MKIEEFRRNEANMNAREQRLAKKDVNDAVSAGAQASLNLMREQYGLKHNEALAFVNNSYMLDKFNVETKLSTAIHNQNTARDIDVTRARLTNDANIANANMANQANITARSTAAQLGLAALEAKYKKDNPAAGSLGFFRELGGGDAVKGMKVYSENLGPEAKGDEALVASYIKNPTALMALEATDPDLAKYIKQKIKLQMVQPVNVPANAPVRP